jgi:hypothetical protein
VPAGGICHSLVSVLPREITRRAKSVSMNATMEALAPYMRGWRSFSAFCETTVVLQYLTRWVRLRLGRSMAAVENSAPPLGGTDRMGGAAAVGK